jgi:ribonuclease G
MAKELIISANVYEKKVALIEEGVVTEFYVERRDENQGVVGNVYKGRVMKVLPGMQSAFVDIGLERDAFLYVEDFKDFEEDEDIDFQDEVKSAVQPQRPDDRKRDRRDRDRPEPRPQREPEVGEISIEPIAIQDVVEQLAEIADERVIEPPPPDELENLPLETSIAEAETESLEEIPASVLAEEEEVAEEIQPADVVRVGDLLLGETTASDIERITDDDIPIVDGETKEPVEEKPRRGRSRKKASAEEVEPEKKSLRSKKGVKSETTPEPEKIEAKIDATKVNRKAVKGDSKKPSRKKKKGETEETAQSNASFERIIDEEDGINRNQAAPAPQEVEVEKPIEKLFQPEPEVEWKVGSFRSKQATETGFERIEDEHAQAAKAAKSDSESEVTPFRHISEAIPDEILEGAKHASPASDSSMNDEPVEDREASIRDFGERSEFAMRRGRGGRGRKDRRPHQKQTRQPVGDQPVEEEATAQTKEEPETFEAEKPDRRPEPRRKPERGGPPTISDLLREGQEVIVQIAKEPIAKKGARITSHIALPGRFLVYMPTVNHVGVSRKIPNDAERLRLKRTVTALRDRESAPGGFIARTACAGVSEQALHDDLRYLIRTWNDIRKKADRTKPPTLVHRDLDLIQRILRDQLAEDFTVIRVDNEIEYARIVEFVNRVQPRLVNRVKLYTGNQPILEKYNVQPEIDKAVKPRVWLKSGGYIVINQTEALVAIDVNTGKFVGKSDRLEDTITKTNLEAAKEVVRQIRLRDLGGIIIVDFIDMEERKNRQRVMQALQEELSNDRSPSKILAINDFGLLAITRKRVKQSLERTLCAPCPYCQGGGMVKSSQTMCYEILEQAKAIAEQVIGSNDIMLRVSPIVAEALHTTEQAVFEEIEANFGSPITIEADPNLHQEQYDFAIA